MITNTSTTLYHKTFDKVKRIETWQRYLYPDTWFFGGVGAGLNRGYDNANDVEIRIPYATNENLDVKNISTGDIVVKGDTNLDINTQQDLKDFQTYNIVSISDNNFGSQPHIHLGGK